MGEDEEASPCHGNLAWKALVAIYLPMKKRRNTKRIRRIRKNGPKSNRLKIKGTAWSIRFKLVSTWRVPERRMKMRVNEEEGKEQEEEQEKNATPCHGGP